MQIDSCLLRWRLSRAAAIGVVTALTAMPVVAQDEERFSPTFEDLPFSEVVRVIAQISRRNVIVDPRAARVLVTYRYEHPMTRDELWALLLQLADEHELAATESAEGVWRIVPANPSPEPQ